MTDRADAISSTAIYRDDVPALLGNSQRVRKGVF
jgi:hypothetical protein